MCRTVPSSFACLFLCVCFARLCSVSARRTGPQDGRLPTVEHTHLHIHTHVDTHTEHGTSASAGAGGRAGHGLLQHPHLQPHHGAHAGGLGGPSGRPTHKHMHTYIRAYIHTCMHASIHPCMCTYTHLHGPSIQPSPHCPPAPFAPTPHPGLGPCARAGRHAAGAFDGRCGS